MSLHHGDASTQTHTQLRFIQELIRLLGTLTLLVRLLIRILKTGRGTQNATLWVRNLNATKTLLGGGACTKILEASFTQGTGKDGPVLGDLSGGLGGFS